MQALTSVISPMSLRMSHDSPGWTVAKRSASSSAVCFIAGMNPLNLSLLWRTELAVERKPFQ